MPYPKSVNAHEPPAAFVEALTSLRTLDLPPGVSVEEIEAPTTLAPYAAAIRFTVDTPATSQPVHALLVVLHDPATQPGWMGTFRLIVHMHATIEEEDINDPLFDQVAWSWLHSALQKSGAGYHSTAGTTTAIRSQSFGDLRLRGEEKQLELRASWTPNTTDLKPHAQAIAQLLAFVAGIVDPAEALGA